jgi:hypothetical protein
MNTKRTPVNPPTRNRFSPTALKTYRRMQKLETQCTCGEPDWSGEYWKHERFKACDQWWDQHRILHRELNAKPWQWPCVETPGAVSPYPAALAKRAGAKYLMLTHLIPPLGAEKQGPFKIPGGPLAETDYRKVVEESGFAGKTIVGTDLATVRLPPK